jgi:hypothetical protein
VLQILSSTPIGCMWFLIPALFCCCFDVCVQSREHLVELQNGCVCCSLRMDLVQAVARLAAAGSFDLLLLESTGVSEPMQVGRVFTSTQIVQKRLVRVISGSQWRLVWYTAPLCICAQISVWCRIQTGPTAYV